MPGNEPKAKSLILARLKELTDEERAVFARVLQLEKEHLHWDSPDLKDNILKVLKEVIK
jgi:hypothetical protein